MPEEFESFFKKEFRMHMLSLEHEDASDFYFSSWQRNRSCWPLLFIRTLIFVGCLSILGFSMLVIKLDYWFLFLTNWGLLLNTISSALAWTVSVVRFLKGPVSSLRTLVNLHWAVFNAAVSIAFFITTSRYMLFSMKLENDFLLRVLDLSEHVINSVMMFFLLITLRQPTRLLHFYIPVVFGILYLLFTLIYYLAGGLSPFNTTWIYPMLDWSKPGGTILCAVISALLLSVIHFIIVGITLCRDALTKQCREPTVMSIQNSLNVSRNVKNSSI